MKLHNVAIYGFLSIEHIELLFVENGHTVLVGKNESGKSNILKALNLLSEDKEFEKLDKKLMYTKPATVVFSFSLTDNEIEICRKKCHEKFFVEKNVMLTTQHTINEFCDSYVTKMFYSVMQGRAGRWSSWGPGNIPSTRETWYISNHDIHNAELKIKPPAETFINESYIKTELSRTEQQALMHHLRPVTMQEICDRISATVKETIAPKDYKFPTLYWHYNSEKHDLPSHVDRGKFSVKPSLCEPLKNIFLLAGIPEERIGETILVERDKGVNQFQTLLSRVSKDMNEYIRSNWKGINDVKIELRSDGDAIAIGIKDPEDIYDFKQRSDGFRRLICFLLAMGARFHKKQIRNALILIDEPETGLHPRNAKDLRNFLIELGKENIVVYATHSISMIDTENIENNLIVTRENNTTKIEIAKEDGTSPAENIYQAIGHSIYDDLKKENIILEGFTDKKLLKSFMTGQRWEKFGKCYMNGVTSIKSALAILDLADRKYFILSDADKSANQEKEELENSVFWYTYKDLNCKAVTLEDFYEEEFFYRIVKEILQQYGIELSNHIENNRIYFIRKFLYQKKEALGQTDGKELKKLVDKILYNIKTQCSKKRKKGDVLDKKVNDMLAKFMEKLNNAK